MIEVFGIVLLVVVAVLLWRRARRAAWLRQEAMPDALRTAELVASEPYYRCTDPVALHGAPDQVYRQADGVWVLVETQRRAPDRVYEADIAPLSIYRVLLAQQPSVQVQPIAPYGDVRLVLPGRVVYRRVTLWDEARVVALHRRYWALRAGQVAPHGARMPGLCRQCGHQARCTLRI